MSISRRSALVGAGAAVVAGVPGAVQGDDAELIALGRQWLERYGQWLRYPISDEDPGMLKRVCAIQDQIAEIPARSPNGALVKLRVAAEHLRLMGEIKADCYSLLTYQAWQGLETECVAADFERLLGRVRP